jgi:predicted transcriptional regulator
MNVLLSIKPKYVEEIFKGNKKYEFRKSIFRLTDELERVYIYSTSPVKKIVGTFTIETIIEDHPKALWKKFKDFSGISKNEFFNYFGANKKGYAIAIGEIEIFDCPSDPRIFIPDFVPPQSFRYIDKKILRGINGTTF